MKIKKIEEVKGYFCDLCSKNARFRAIIFFNGKWERQYFCKRDLNNFYVFAKEFKKAYEEKFNVRKKR